VDSGNGFGTRVFWTAVVPDGDVQVNPGAGTAQLHVHDLPEFDYAADGFAGNVSLGPLWQSAYVPATVSFDVVWNGPVTRRVDVKDAANGFAGQFNEDQATVTWSAHSDSGFSFTSNPGNFSTSVPETPGVNGVTAPLNFFAEVGHERNGIFFPSPDGKKETQAAQGDNEHAALSSLAAPTTPDAGLYALPGAGAAPAAGPAPWSPPRTDGPVAGGLDREQPTQPTSALPPAAVRAAHAQVVDQVFADADGHAPRDALGGDGLAAWAV
jgi:hypothetical protein